MPQARVSGRLRRQHSSIQKLLGEFQYSPTHSTWEKIVDAAIRFEIADVAVRRMGKTGFSERAEGSGQDTFKWPKTTSSQKNRQGRFRCREGRKSPREVSRTRGSPRNQAGPSRPSNQRATPSLSDKEKADLAAAVKCFDCKETGHISRHCPKRNRVKSHFKARRECKRTP